MHGNLKAIWRYSWLLGFTLFWVFLAASISRNPWFSFWRHALSDLGDARRATDPWIYNTGLIAVATLLCIYSLYIAYESKRKLVVFSSALLFTAGIFLALIGLFPSGTRPHVFVSTWFFVQVWLSSIPLLIDSIASRKSFYIASMVTVSIIAPIAAYIVEIVVGWPSVAILEIYGAIIVGFYLATLAHIVNGK
jgi:hypothetical membrane protein